MTVRAVVAHDIIFTQMHFPPAASGGFHNQLLGGFTCSHQYFVLPFPFLSFSLCPLARHHISAEPSWRNMATRWRRPNDRWFHWIWTFILSIWPFETTNIDCLTFSLFFSFLFVRKKITKLKCLEILKKYFIVVFTVCTYTVYRTLTRNVWFE